MKKTLLLVLAIMIIVSMFGCAPTMQQYQTEFIDTFDTVVSVIGYARTQDEFTKTAQMVYENLPVGEAG